MLTTIAQALNIKPEQIKRFEVWSNCILVVIKGVGARFLSKKSISQDLLTKHIKMVRMATKHGWRVIPQVFGWVVAGVFIDTYDCAVEYHILDAIHSNKIAF